MILNYHRGDKILFRDPGKSNERHFYRWSRKLLKPNTILTLMEYPSNNGFCMATDQNGSLFHINVITDNITLLKQKRL